MLGGSVTIAAIRFVLSIIGTTILFALLDEPRFERKKMILYYGCFCVAVTIPSCIWYYLDYTSCIRVVAFTIFILFSVFSIFLSSSRIYLTLYKLALTFYLMAVFVVGGIEISYIFFNGNIWADIIARALLILAMAYFISKNLKDSIKSFGIYVESELDQFSITVLIISILFGIGVVFRSPGEAFNIKNLFQIMVNFFLTGALQLMVFRLYLHIGKEGEYLKENQLMQMNHRLLERQIELLEESVESGRRIRHDTRHHNLVIAEYVRRGQSEELLKYLKEYEQELDKGVMAVICENTAVNNILAAYTRKAEREQIKVTMDVEMEKESGIADIDMVTILSNAYENAIYGCLEARKQSRERECLINLLVKKKKGKVVICCSNTCRMDMDFKKGQPKPEFTGGVGISSIIKTAESYEGETDFRNDNGVFVFRLIMNIPKTGEKQN